MLVIRKCNPPLPELVGILDFPDRRTKITHVAITACRYQKNNGACLYVVTLALRNERLYSYDYIVVVAVVDCPWYHASEQTKRPHDLEGEYPFSIG